MFANFQNMFVFLPPFPWLLVRGSHVGIGILASDIGLICSTESLTQQHATIGAHGCYLMGHQTMSLNKLAWIICWGSPPRKNNYRADDVLEPPQMDDFHEILQMWSRHYERCTQQRNLWRLRGSVLILWLRLWVKTQHVTATCVRTKHYHKPFVIVSNDASAIVVLNHRISNV